MRNAILSRRDFLLGAGGWLAHSQYRSWAAERNLSTVSIFHTTDLHGHIVPTTDYSGNADLGGLARCATYVKAARKAAPHSLLVDIGDVYQGTAESYLNQGTLMMDLFQKLGYDAWALGNHDFDWGPEALENNVRRSSAPILTGNLRFDGKMAGEADGVWARVKPWMMKEVGGWKIALIGLTTPGLPYWLPARTLGPAQVSDPAESLKQSVAEAKAAGAQAIVVLGHMGYRYADDFANPLQAIFRKAPGVDAYLGGHTHQLQPSWEIEGVLCSQASYHGIHCGRLDLTFDRDSGVLVHKVAGVTLMDNRFDLDPVTTETAQPELRKAAEHLERKIGVIANVIGGKGRGSALTRLLCEAFSAALERAGMAVDGVFHGTFGTGDLPPGDFTVADCWNILPYENFLVTGVLTARELLEVLREDAATKSSDRTLWPFEVVTGSDLLPSDLMYEGKPVSPDRTFVIGFNSYDAQSAGQRLMRLGGLLERPAAQRRMTSIETRQALIDEILLRKSVS